MNERISLTYRGPTFVRGSQTRPGDILARLLKVSHTLRHERLLMMGSCDVVKPLSKRLGVVNLVLGTMIGDISTI